jgi:hypothetical protein
LDELYRERDVHHHYVCPFVVVIRTPHLLVDDQQLAVADPNLVGDDDHRAGHPPATDNERLGNDRAGDDHDGTGRDDHYRDYHDVIRPGHHHGCAAQG